ncbi:hypothetical protein HWV62_22429 [Athelia sp. TMB]|nr:hypothetical protein HWV62_22429 [Athelia sp. TMB]
MAIASGSGSTSNSFVHWEIVENILNGNEEIICHQDTNQYAGDSGRSACGLAALNFARCAFREARSPSPGEGEPINPLFYNAQDAILLRALISRKTVEEITSICSQWESDTHLDVEEICTIPIFDQAVRLVRTNYGRPGPAAFEGLLRPDYPYGSGLILNTSIRGTAARLSSILPVDNQLLAQTNMQWQTQMLANHSSHIFVPRDINGTSEALTQALITSSLKILALQAEIADLRSRNSALVSKQRQMDAESETKELTTRKRDWPWSSLPFSLLSVNKRYYSESSAESWLAISAGNSPIAEPSPSRQHFASLEPSTYQPSRPSTSYSIDLSQRFSSATAIHFDDIISPDYAFDKQQQNGDRIVRPKGPRAEYVLPPQRLFTCGVCFDEQPEDFITRIDTCDHQFCRDCIQGHVKSKLQERRFPVMCPSCMTSQSGAPGGSFPSHFHAVTST